MHSRQLFFRQYTVIMLLSVYILSLPITIDVLFLMKNMFQSIIQDAVKNMAEKNLGPAAGGVVDILMGGLAKNASHEQWAEQLLETLDRHDASTTTTKGPDEIEKMLGHILGDKKARTAADIAKTFNIDSSDAIGLLQKMAPVVLWALGSEKKEGGLNLDSLTNILGLELKKGQNDNMVTWIIKNLIDQDNDGSIIDDLFNIGKKFL